MAVSPEASLRASEAIEFVAREEFDFSILEVAEGRALAEIDGISFRDGERIPIEAPPGGDRTGSDVEFEPMPKW